MNPWRDLTTCMRVNRSEVSINFGALPCCVNLCSNLNSTTVSRGPSNCTEIFAVYLLLSKCASHPDVILYQTLTICPLSLSSIVATCLA